MRCGFTQSGISFGSGVQQASLSAFPNTIAAVAEQAWLRVMPEFFLGSSQASPPSLLGLNAKPLSMQSTGRVPAGKMRVRVVGRDAV